MQTKYVYSYTYIFSYINVYIFTYITTFYKFTYIYMYAYIFVCVHTYTQITYALVIFRPKLSEWHGYNWFFLIKNFFSIGNFNKLAIMFRADSSEVTSLMVFRIPIFCSFLFLIVYLCLYRWEFLWIYFKCLSC